MNTIILERLQLIAFPTSTQFAPPLTRPLSYLTDYLSPSIISQADCRAYFLSPFEIARYSHLVRECKTKDKNRSIEYIKARKTPTTKTRSAPFPPLPLVNAPLEPGLDDVWAVALQDQKLSLLCSLDSSSSLPLFPPPLLYLPITFPPPIRMETEWNLHALSVFSENPAALLHAAPYLHTYRQEPPPRGMGARRKAQSCHSFSRVWASRMTYQNIVYRENDAQGE